MMVRSWLFVPADSEKKLAKIDEGRADAYLLDLEDSVAATRKPVARELLRAFLLERPQQVRRAQLWVRINPLETPDALSDLAAVVELAPDGIMLPKAAGPDDVLTLGHYLDALEVTAGLGRGSVRIMPLVSETAGAALRIPAYADAVLPRVQGLTWGAEDLSAALGATTNKGADGQWSFSYQMVRSQTLLAAHALGVQPIDTLFVDYRDEQGLRVACRNSRAEGFSGRLAIHPAQVDAINEEYLPSAAEAELAGRIIEAFDSHPGLGTVGMDGKMYDMPHLRQARRTLDMFRRYASSR